MSHNPVDPIRHAWEHCNGRAPFPHILRKGAGATPAPSAPDARPAPTVTAPVSEETVLRVLQALKAPPSLASQPDASDEETAGVPPLESEATDRPRLSGQQMDSRPADQSTHQVAVYRFRIWDLQLSDYVWMPRPATLEAIARMDGAAELASEQWVDHSVVDAEGFCVPSGA
jgi:hypothetical protein